jgi:hypothetical protein
MWPIRDNISFEERHGYYAELRQLIVDLAKKAEALEKRQNVSDQYILFLKELIKDSWRKV